MLIRRLISWPTVLKSTPCSVASNSEWRNIYENIKYGSKGAHSSSRWSPIGVTYILSFQIHFKIPSRTDFPQFNKSKTVTDLSDCMNNWHQCRFIGLISDGWRPWLTTPPASGQTFISYSLPSFATPKQLLFRMQTSFSSIRKQDYSLDWEGHRTNSREHGNCHQDLREQTALVSVTGYVRSGPKILETPML